MNPQLEPILSEIEKAVVGKRGVIEKILMALLAEGHILLGRRAGRRQNDARRRAQPCVGA